MDMEFQTKLLHGKSVDNYANGSTVPPISLANAFAYESSEQLEKVFQNRAPGFAYTRIANPTVDAFERRVNELEGGIGGVAWFLRNGQQLPCHCLIFCRRAMR